MASVSIILAIGAFLLVLAAVLLGLRAALQERRAIARLADERGWSHAARGGETFDQVAARVSPGEAPPELRDVLSGPSHAGPFTLARARIAGARSASGEHSVLHIRTTGTSPGLHLEPAPHFRAGPPLGTAVSERFARLFEISAADNAFAEEALDWDTCSLLAAPGRPVRLDWRDRDLVIAFPFAARTPAAVESVVTWGTHLAASLTRPHEKPWAGRTSGRQAAQPTPRPATGDAAPA